MIDEFSRTVNLRSRAFIVTKGVAIYRIKGFSVCSFFNRV